MTLIIGQNRYQCPALYSGGLRKYRMEIRETTDLWMVAAAAVFAIAVVIFFSEVRSDYFSSNYDRSNYVDRIEYLQGVDAVDLISFNTVLSLLSAELGWQYVLFIIGHLLQSPENGLNLIAVISLWIFAVFCLRYHTSPYITFLFLLNPIVIDLVMCQSRSALALAILMLAHMSGRRFWFLIGAVVAQSIHFSAIVFVAIYVLSRYVSANLPLFSYSIKKSVVMGGGVLFAYLILFGRNAFLVLSGDYRGLIEYGSSSILYFLFWFYLLFMLVLLPKNAGRRSWQYFYAICILTLSLIFTLANFYNTRFIALTFPIILNSISDMTRPVQYLLYAGLFLYQSVQYYYWIFAG